HASTNYLSTFYAQMQIILRGLVAAHTLEELLENRKAFDESLLVEAAKTATELGLTVTHCAVRDIMLPAGLKRAMAGIMEAKKDAQAQMEKARGEQAVLRSLANLASLYETHPSLAQARVIQALSSGNHTIVFGADSRAAVAAGNR